MKDFLRSEGHEFPENRHNLTNGSLLRSVEAMSWAGLEKDQVFAIHFDGEYIRAGGLTWGVDQICNEIDTGIWEVSREVEERTTGDVRSDISSFVEKSIHGIPTTEGENIFQYISSKFHSENLGSANSIPVKIGEYALDVVIFSSSEDEVSFGLFLEGHRYSRKTLLINKEGVISEDTTGVLPDFDKSWNEPDFSDISNQEITSMVLTQLENRGIDSASIPEIRNGKLESAIERINKHSRNTLRLAKWKPWDGEVGIDELSLFDPESGGENGDFSYIIILFLEIDRDWLTKDQIIQKGVEDDSEEEENLDPRKNRIKQTIDNMLRAGVLKQGTNGKITSNVILRG